MGKRKLKSQSKASATRWAKKPKPLPLPQTWDTGATGPAAMARERVVEDAFDVDPETGDVVNPNGIRRIRIVDMLEVWHKKSIITTAGFNFAVKLRDAFEATGRAPGWPDNDRVQSSPKPDHAVAIQIDRMSRFHAVARFVSQEDRPLISYFVLRDRSDGLRREMEGTRYKAALAALGPALDRCAAAMDQPSRIARMIRAIR